uniref:Uncharacterized protein n=1 Tax=Rhizophora mucronata TaxID=61149 RepID=A0A2P2NK20_RHIMU
MLSSGDADAGERDSAQPHARAESTQREG